MGAQPIGSRERERRYSGFEALIESADRAGMIAVFEDFALFAASNPEYAGVDPFTTDCLPGDYCGFVWIITKGNTSFGRWAKRAKGWEKGYRGVRMFVSRFGMTMRRNEIYAEPFVGALNQAGIEARCVSRID